jgi:hypothetical protein
MWLKSVALFGVIGVCAQRSQFNIACFPTNKTKPSGVVAGGWVENQLRG